MLFVLGMFIACGDKEEDTSSEEEIVDTANAEDTANEEEENDTGSEEPAE